jgi:hypothetical protein
MEEETTRNDIRKLLKTFGVRADERIIAHLARNPGSPPLHLRITLTDLTEYSDAQPDRPLHFEVDGEVRV